MGLSEDFFTLLLCAESPSPPEMTPAECHQPGSQNSKTTPATGLLGQRAQQAGLTDSWLSWRNSSLSWGDWAMLGLGLHGSAG